MKRALTLVGLLSAVPAYAQTISLPAMCSVGERYTYTAVTPALNLTCVAPGLWQGTTLLNTADSLTDTTTNNATSGKHGLLPKLSGSASDVLHGDGSWGPAAGGGIPAGLITVIVAGACPATWTEVSALNGKMLRGTLAANGDVGTAAGSDAITPTGTVSQPIVTMNSYTPAGTNATVSFTPSGTIAWPAAVPTFAGGAGTVAAQSFTGSSATSGATTGGTPAGTVTAPVFTGNALATHAHELPFQIASTTIFRQIAAATFGSGTSRAATATQTHTANTTSAAVALSQAVTAGTPAGTNSAPTFTGSALATHTHTVTATGTNGTVSFTPAGTIAWPAGVPTLTGASGTVPAEAFTGTAATLTGTVSQPTFTGASFNNRPAYVNVIFCQKS